jgi:hypothetical protein
VEVKIVEKIRETKKKKKVSTFPSLGQFIIGGVIIKKWKIKERRYPRVAWNITSFIYR